MDNLVQADQPPNTTRKLVMRRRSKCSTAVPNNPRTKHAKTRNTNEKNKLNHKEYTKS